MAEGPECEAKVWNSLHVPQRCKLGQRIRHVLQAVAIQSQFAQLPRKFESTKEERRKKEGERERESVCVCAK